MPAMLAPLAAQLLPASQSLQEAKYNLIKELHNASSSQRVRQTAWQAYQQAAEDIIDALPDAARPGGQIGLLIDKALIWDSVGYKHHVLLELVSAEMYARNIGDGALGEKLATHTAVTYSEALEAEIEGRYDDAIDLYIAVEQFELPEEDRGQLNLGTAYCYYYLIQDGDDSAVLGEHLQAALESALAYLGDHPEAIEATRLLGDAVDERIIKV